MIKMRKSEAVSICNIYDAITAFNIDPWIGGEKIDEIIFNHLVQTIEENIEGTIERFRIPVFNINFKESKQHAELIHHTFGKFHTIITVRNCVVNAGDKTRESKIEAKKNGVPKDSIMPLLDYYNEIKWGKKFTNDKPNYQENEVWVMPCCRALFIEDTNEDSENTIKEIIEKFRTKEFCYSRQNDWVNRENGITLNINSIFQTQSYYDSNNSYKSKDYLSSFVLSTIVKLYSKYAIDRNAVEINNNIQSFSLASICAQSFKYPEDYICRVDAMNNTIDMYFKSIGQVKIFRNQYEKRYDVTIYHLYTKDPGTPSFTIWKHSEKPYKVFKYNNDGTNIGLTYKQEILEFTYLNDSHMKDIPCVTVDDIVKLINDALERVIKSWTPEELEFIQQKNMISIPCDVWDNY